ncbi:hypothetical protein [Mesorhizobium sp. J428]|uniref:hypothetical protein n=1 Tax=Mesorhizobium sp. J428 TaxID=2898440 RepID=UPI0021509FC5|nr:hypothetical protein [Mesorhizobium sp. J428]MCR5858251.1 hypothetical protein [Mesorhizobium sp. J428]
MLSDAVRYTSAVVDLLGDSELTDDEIERRALHLTGDEMVTRRLIDWIPEVFAYVLIGHHLKQFELDSTFQAQSVSGDWRSFSFRSEPIAAWAEAIANAMIQDGPREHFRRVVERSSTLDAANNALNANPDFAGILSGPAFIGIPAETYAGQDA